MKELWKPICNYPGYEVSDLGRVRKGTRIKRLTIGRNGYVYTGLTNSKGKSKTFLVHRLVGEAFVFKPATIEKLDINHKDGLKTNNVANNLEWATRAANIQHAFITGLNKVPRLFTPLEEDTMLWLYEIAGRTQQDIASEYGVHQSTVSRGIKNAKERFSVAR